MWGLWTLVMIAVFNSVQGTLHSYYTVVLAPGVAALAGAGCVELWHLGRHRRWLAWLLPGAVAGTAAWSATLLSRVSDFAPGLSTAVLAVGLAAAAGLWLVLAMPAKGPAGVRPWRAAASVVAAMSLAALLAGPFAFAVGTIERSVTGNTAAAGPKGSSSGGGDLSVDEGLIAYLQKNRGDAKYLVAVQTTSNSVPIILATGEPVVSIGGYKSRDPFPIAAELESMVAAGEVHYVLLTGETGSTSGSAGGSAETLQALTEWVAATGMVVDGAEYGGSSEGRLYYLP